MSVSATFETVEIRPGPVESRALYSARMPHAARAQSVGSKPSPLCLCAATLPVVSCEAIAALTMTVEASSRASGLIGYQQE